MLACLVKLDGYARLEAMDERSTGRIASSLRSERIIYTLRKLAEELATERRRVALLRRENRELRAQLELSTRADRDQRASRWTRRRAGRRYGLVPRGL